MTSLSRRENNGKAIEEIKNEAYDWNQNHCQPPQDDKKVEHQWKCALYHFTYVHKLFLVNSFSY